MAGVVRPVAELTPERLTALLGLGGVSSEVRLFGVMGALARFHITWWEHPRLNRHPATLLAGAKRRLGSVGKSQEHRQDYDSFIRTHGRSVSAETRTLLEHVLKAYEAV